MPLLTKATEFLWTHARVLERRLDALAADQQDDGGWPIRWTPPGPAAVSEWRGKWTLDALRTLRAYGRI